jgi:hypothetical protein
MRDLNKYQQNLNKLLKSALLIPIGNADDLQKISVIKQHSFSAPGITDPSIFVMILLTFDVCIGVQISNLPCLHLSISESGTYDGYSKNPYYKPKIASNNEIKAWFDLFFMHVFPGYELYVEREELNNGMCTHFRLNFDKVGGEPVKSNFTSNPI